MTTPIAEHNQYRHSVPVTIPISRKSTIQVEAEAWCRCTGEGRPVTPSIGCSCNFTDSNLDSDSSIAGGPSTAEHSLGLVSYAGVALLTATGQNYLSP